MDRSEWRVPGSRTLGDAVLQPPLRRVEGIAHGDEDVLVRLHVVMRRGDDDGWPAGKSELDADGEEVALALVMMRRIDHHMTTHDAIAYVLEGRDLLADPVLDHLRSLHSTKRDLNWALHRRIELLVFGW